MNNTVEREIDELLVKIGIKSNLKGKKYLVDAISIIIYDSNAKMEDIYFSISNLYNVTRCSVERAIRHAIEDVFLNANYEKMYDYFGNMICTKSGKLTNSTFIYRCAEIIKEANNGQD